MGTAPWGPHDEHRLRNELSRRRLLRSTLAVAAAAGLAACSNEKTAAGSGSPTTMARGSGTTTSAVDRAVRRSAVVLPPGTRPFPDRPEGVDTLPEIEHIVIYMQENHSFDSFLGTLGRGDGLKLGKDGLPVNTNIGQGGTTVRSFHQADTCVTISGDHGWNGTHRSWNNGKMDRFAEVSGDHVMGYFDETNIPFYHGLASTFPLCDRWFASVPGPTHPNRRFLIAGTSAGMITTSVIANPTPPNGTIFDRLDAHGITWTDYAIDFWDVMLFPGTDFGGFMSGTADNRKHFEDFLADCRNGSLPSVSVIGPGTAEQYDEGSQDVRNGESFSYSIINGVMDSPLWDRTAIFFTYDEHGGCFDHVPPPSTLTPDDIAPRLKPGDEPGAFDRYGIRVPGYVISPWAKKDHVSSVVRDHTAILKFIETKWNLGALTHRDANADDLMDCFDFKRPAFADPPVLQKPGLPEGGSPCQPQPRPAVNPSARLGTA